MPDGERAPTHPVPVLRSERLYLRAAERSDLPSFVRWFADAETIRHLAFRAPFSLAMEEQWFNGLLQRQGTTDYHFVACLIPDGRPIGTAGLHQLDLENGQAAFGISIGEKEEWNRGYGTEALNAITDFGFGQLRLERIWLDVYAENRRAQRSYEKAGFRLEGTLRHAHFADGEFHDVLRMALLREEWLALPRKRGWDLWPQR